MCETNFKFFHPSPLEFSAFKFPDKDIIHFNCGIILCKGDCPKECDDIGENLLLQKPLARLEIFNSIRVIAPQIEAIDRMGRNLTVAGELILIFNNY